MKKYFKALYQSFGHPKLYADVIYRWAGNGARYLFVLSLMISILFAVKFAVMIHIFTRSELNDLLLQMPTITISKGQVETEAPQPYVMRDKENNVIVTMDTTKSRTELKKEKGAILIGKDVIYARVSDEQITTYELDKFKDRKMIINGPVLVNFTQKLPFLTLIFFPVITLGQWMLTLAMAVTAACLSYFITAYMTEEYDFDTRMRIGAIAITPPFIINILLQNFANYHIAFPLIMLMWCLYIYMMIVAVRSIPKPEQPSES